MSVLGHTLRLALASGLFLTVATASAQKGETVKIGWIDHCRA